MVKKKDGNLAERQPETDVGKLDKASTWDGTSLRLSFDKIKCVSDRAIDPEGLRTLAATIQATGLINPITLVKLTHPEISVPPVCYEYEVIAGRRRFRAMVEILKQQDFIEGSDFRLMPAGSDTEAISLIENFERQNLTLCEEVDFINKLRERLGLDEIAKLLGRTKAWVSLRSNLDNLSKKWRKELESGERKDITPGHYEAVARFPHSIQNEILDGLYGRCPSLKNFKESIEDKAMRKMANVPFDVTDCKKCKKRSQATEWLFNDLKEPEKDRCLDAACYNKKLEAYIKSEEKKIEAANKKGVVIHRISTRCWNNSPKVLVTGGYERIDHLKSRPQEPNAFIVEGDNIGTYCYIKLNKENKPSGSDDTSGYGAKKEKTMADREAELKHKREKRAIEMIVANFKNDLADVIYSRPDMLTMFRLTACLGVSPLEYSMSGLHGYKKVCAMPDEELLTGYWKKLLDCITGNLNQDISGTLDCIRTERAKIICDIVDMKWKDFFAQATDEIKEPKGWAALRAAEEKAKKKATDKTEEK